MADEITMDELNETIEALLLSLTEMKGMRARHACPVRPGEVLEVSRSGDITSKGVLVGKIAPYIAKQVTPSVMVDRISPLDIEPYYRLVVNEKKGEGWDDRPVCLEVD
jgi:hypothetical protein